MRSDYVKFAYSAVVTAATFLALGATPNAQKKYDLGASDSEIKVGNIMPYSGPASAYATIGKNRSGLLQQDQL